MLTTERTEDTEKGIERLGRCGPALLRKSSVLSVSSVVSPLLSDRG